MSCSRSNKEIEEVKREYYQIFSTIQTNFDNAFLTATFGVPFNHARLDSTRKYIAMELIKVHFADITRLGELYRVLLDEGCVVERLTDTNEEDKK